MYDSITYKPYSLYWPYAQNIDVALIIDSLGSVTGSDPNDLRKEAARIFVDLIYGRPGSVVRLSVPIHGNQPLKVGLLRHLLKMAELTESDIET